MQAICFLVRTMVNSKSYVCKLTYVCSGDLTTGVRIDMYDGHDWMGAVVFDGHAAQPAPWRQAAWPEARGASWMDLAIAQFFENKLGAQILACPKEEQHVRMPAIHYMDS